MTSLLPRVQPTGRERAHCDVGGVAILLGALATSVAAWGVLVLVVLLLLG